MEVFFLGTGAAEGIPALFCECPVCIGAHRRGGREKRTRSTVLIDGRIKIDLPPDTLAHVHQYPQVCLSRMEHLLFTHSHDDHFAARELQYLSPNFAPTRATKLNVYGTADLLEKAQQETSHFFEEAPLRYHAFLPYEPFAVGHLHAIPIVARHKQDELCVNFLLSDPDGDKTLLYASDTGWYDAPTWEFLRGQKIDSVIVECGKGQSANGYDGHLDITGCARFKEKLAADGVTPSDVPFYLTHISHTGLLLHEEMGKIVAAYGMTVAYDGMTITV